MGHETSPEYLTPSSALQVLLVNPPIFDFTAFDFWLLPYGMLRVAGRMKHSCRIRMFDYLVSRKKDAWGRGPFESARAEKPKALSDIPRRYRRFGRPRSEFREFLRRHRFDAALIQTMMTYWYPGVREVIEDLRELQPSAKIVIGGVYTTLCPSHAQSLGADLVIENDDLAPLWNLLSVEPETGLPYWPAGYTDTGVLKLTEGCPFRCTYCSAPLFWQGFSARPLRECIEEFAQLTASGAKNVAFYDDALLFKPDQVLIPFLKACETAGRNPVSFHTPNALNARFVTTDLAELMVRSGFSSFFLGLESSVPGWQRETGAKVDNQQFRKAVDALGKAGASAVVTYVIVGHPDSEDQEPELAMRFAHSCGTRILLSEYSPVPGTPDALKCGPWADLNEPLSHNKTAFAIRRLGPDYLNRLKDLCRSLNAELV